MATLAMERSGSSFSNLIASAGISDWFYGESWEFIDSVGGIAISDPVQNANGTVTLPLRCGVSGLTTNPSDDLPGR
jgi:hypothetical protein